MFEMQVEEDEDGELIFSLQNLAFASIRYSTVWRVYDCDDQCAEFDSRAEALDYVFNNTEFLLNLIFA